MQLAAYAGNAQSNDADSNDRGDYAHDQHKMDVMADHALTCHIRTYHNRFFVGPLLAHDTDNVPRAEHVALPLVGAALTASRAAVAVNTPSWF